MKITQVTALMQAAANALIGANYFPVTTVAEAGTAPNTYLTPDNTAPSPYTLTAQDVTGLVDIGRAVQNFGQPAFDLCFKTLVDQIGRMVIDTRQFVADLPDIFVDPREWGGFVQWVRVGLSDVMDDPMWEEMWMYNYNDPLTAASSYTETLGGGRAHARKIAEINNGNYRPKVRGKVYDKAHAIMIPLSIMKDQMFTAFKGWDEANEFLSALYNSVYNTLQYRAKCYAMAAICTGIALSTKHGNCINLLEAAHNMGMYQNITTVAAALQETELMQWMGMYIKNVRDQAKEMTTCYNDGFDPTFTPEEDGRLLLNAQWANLFKFTVAANTFNDELLGFGDFKKMACWEAVQTASSGVGTKFDFDTVTTVKLNDTAITNLGIDNSFVDKTAGSGKYVMTIPHVIGFFYDKQGIGMTLQKEKVTTHYSAADDKQNMFYHSLFQYCVNDAYNMVTFYLADHSIPEPASADAEGGAS